MASAYSEILTRLWTALGGASELTKRVPVPAPEVVLPSVFAVDDLAAATVAAATLGAAELLAARDESVLREVSVSRRQASAAFLRRRSFPRRAGSGRRSGIRSPVTTRRPTAGSGCTPITATTAMPSRGCSATSRNGRKWLQRGEMDRRRLGDGGRRGRRLRGGNAPPAGVAGSPAGPPRPGNRSSAARTPHGPTREIRRTGGGRWKAFASST